MTALAYPHDGWVVEVLGPCRLVNRATTPPTVVKPSDLQALLMGLLVMAAPEALDRDELSDRLWRGQPPTSARAALQNQISRLRARSHDALVETTPTGYRLGVASDLDHVRRAVTDAERLQYEGDAAAADRVAEAALARFRGRPLAELDQLELVDPVLVVRREFDEIRRSLENVRVGAATSLGRVPWSIREAERLVASTPLDEGRWQLLVEALHRAGRRGDALAAVDRARRALRSQLGIGPGERLLAAEAAVLEAHASPRRSAVVSSASVRPIEVERMVRHAQRGGVVVVSGEHGIGRSATLQAVFRQVRRAGYRTAHVGVERPGGAALAPLDDVLDELGVVAPPQHGRVSGFLKAIHEVVDIEPLVLVVDDIDHAGPTSRATLLAAAQHPRVGLVASTHDTSWLDGLAPEPLSIELGPLTPTDVLGLVTSVDPRAAAAAEPQWWTAMSGGNPSLLRCLLDDFADGQLDMSLAPAQPGMHLAAAIQRRIDDLGTAGRAAVEATAVCGPSATTDLVSRLATPQGVTTMLAADMVVLEGGQLRFRHDAAHIAAYHGIADLRRAELHLQVAEYEAQHGGDLEVVAHHGLAAAELDPRRAVDAGLAAAVSASRKGAHLDAARWYQRTVDAARLTGDPVDRVRALIGRGDELRLAGDADHAERLLEAVESAEQLGDAALIAEAVFGLVQLGATSETGMLHQRAIEVADRTLARLPDSHPGWAQVAAAASIAQSLFGDVVRSRQLFLAAEANAVDEQVRLRVLPATYLALGRPDDLDRRIHLTNQLLQLADRHDSAVAQFEGQHLRFSNALQCADGDAARDAVERMGHLVTTVGDAGRRWQYLYCTAAVAHLDHDLEAAEHWTEEAYQLFSGVSPSRAFAARISQLLVIRLAQGRLADLADTFAHLVQTQPEVAAWHPLYAATCVERDADQAAFHAERALDALPRDFTWLAAHLMGAHAVARLAQPDLIDAYRRRLEPWAHRVAWQGTCAYGPVAGTLAALAEAAQDHDAAEQFRRTANRLAASLRAPVFAQRL